MPDKLPLPAIERRLLGVLVEKAKTSPDSYPLSLNALVVGSNQKSNREPVMNLDDVTVEDGLGALQSRGLVTRIQGGRVERWRHNLYEQWKVDKVELAILAELLLRGAQTEGELRTRASRMEPIEDLDALRTRLGPLAERGMVVFLGPEGRGRQVTHGFHGPEELARLRDNAGRVEYASETPAASPRTPNQAAPLHEELNQVRADLAALRDEVRELRDELSALKQSLGQ